MALPIFKILSGYTFSMSAEKKQYLQVGRLVFKKELFP